MNLDTRQAPERQRTFANRLGITAPESPLLWKLRRLRAKYPSGEAASLEAWLVNVANSRGANIVQRRDATAGFRVPVEALSLEELAVALLLPSLIDEPQILRLAAQIISRGKLDQNQLVIIARREGALRILKNLAAQALRVAADHPIWSSIAATPDRNRPLTENVLHWTRLAEPVMPLNDVHRGQWRLVS